MKISSALLLILFSLCAYSGLDRLLFVNYSTKDFGLTSVDALTASQLRLDEDCVNDEDTRYEFKINNDNVLTLRCSKPSFNGQHITIWPFYSETIVQSVTTEDLSKYPKVFTIK
jgi:hypothetical protein